MALHKTYYVYILASTCNAVLYVGVTSNLEKRIEEHRQKAFTGFTSKYHVKKLVFFEETIEIGSAFLREKQLKNWSRKKKVWLIEKVNPYWIDLLPEQTGPSTRRTRSG